MHPAIEYFLYTGRKNLSFIMAIVLIPAVLPFILYGIMFAIIKGPDDVTLTPVNMEKLPQTNRVAYNDSNLVYFSYSPDKP